MREDKSQTKEKKLGEMTLTMSPDSDKLKLKLAAGRFHNR